MKPIDKKVFIYSIPRPTATGIDDWTNTSSGVKMKKTKIGRCNDALQAMYSAQVGGLKNGLSYKPWVGEEGKQVTDESGNKLTLQDREEKRWNLAKGFLSNRPWRKGDPTTSETMSYYQKTSWKLNDGATVLDLNNFDDAMFYYVILDSALVANSEAEWRAHKWPKATHYVALENEAEELKFKKNQTKSQTFALLHSKHMVPTIADKLAKVLGLAKTTATLTQEQVHNVLFDYLDKSSFTEGSNIDKFKEVYNLLTTAEGRIEFESRFLLQQALDTRVVYEKQGAYKWPRSTGLIELGETYPEAIEFLTNPKKTSLQEELIGEIKAKL